MQQEETRLGRIGFTTSGLSTPLQFIDSTENGIFTIRDTTSSTSAVEVLTISKEPPFEIKA